VNRRQSKPFSIEVPRLTVTKEKIGVESNVTVSTHDKIAGKVSQRTSKNSSVNAEYKQYKNVKGKHGPNSLAFQNDLVVRGKEPDNWQLKEMQGESNNCSQRCREQHCPARN
jgi:hypothetical protein